MLRRIKSFVRRDSRMTESQRQAFDLLWPRFGIFLDERLESSAKLFNRQAPIIVEIGFGSGLSLLKHAKANPEENFIGIETYKPGIGALLLRMQTQQLENIRVHYGDAVEFLEKNVPDNFFQGIQIFFPDPWPKRRHHKRRLIQPDFIQLLSTKLVHKGQLHLATDWENYAEHMMRVLSENAHLENVSGVGNFSQRSEKRPVITKFEGRGIASGRKIWELQFAKKSNIDQ